MWIAYKITVYVSVSVIACIHINVEIIYIALCQSDTQESSLDKFVQLVSYAMHT